MAAGEREFYRPENAVIPVVVMAVMWAAGAGLWLVGGDILAAGLVVYVGLIAGVGVGVYLVLPRRKRPLGR